VAKPLVVQLAGVDLPLDLNKVERSDLYGYIETEVQDAAGRPCRPATLADDGQTLIGPGGAAMATLSADGLWLSRKQLTPVDAEGRELEPVPSSFAAPVPLVRKATVDEYLSHNIRAVYQISSTVDLAPLLAELRAGTIFMFPYSFRGGLEPDAGFLLLSADGQPFLAIGVPTKIEFVGLPQSAVSVEEEGAAEEEAEEIDFGMM
jgi:hypothetical protein